MRAQSGAWSVHQYSAAGGFFLPLPMPDGLFLRFAAHLLGKPKKDRSPDLRIACFDDFGSSKRGNSESIR